MKHVFRMTDLSVQVRKGLHQDCFHFNDNNNNANISTLMGVQQGIFKKKSERETDATAL